MAETLNTFSNLSLDALQYVINRRMYTLAERTLPLGSLAQEYTLEQQMGNTMRLMRLRRIDLPIEPLPEGIPPASSNLAWDNVDVSLEQWGIVTTITDIAQAQLFHPILALAVDRTGLAIAEVIEREIAKVLMTGTNVVFPPGVSDRTGITDGATSNAMRFSTDIVLQCIVQLAARGALPFENGVYAGVLQPQHEGDIAGSDSSFVQAAAYSQVRRLNYAEIGAWMRANWKRGNFMPFFVGVAAPSTSANSATVTKFTISDSGGTMTRAGAGQFKVQAVARDISSDYERKISQLSAAGTLGSGVTTGSMTFLTPTSTNYVYDLYMTLEGGSIPYLVASRVPAATTRIITASPAGTEAVAPTAPASGVSVFPGWIMGKDAFARVKLNGMSMQSYVTPAGPTVPDPLAQIRKVGCKYKQKAVIQDNAYMVRFEVSSRFGNYLAA